MLLFAIVVINRLFCFLNSDEKESRNIKKAPSNELGVEIEPNTIKNQNNDEQLWEILDDDEENSNEQSENRENWLPR